MLITNALLALRSFLTASKSSVINNPTLQHKKELTVSRMAFQRLYYRQSHHATTYLALPTSFRMRATIGRIRVGSVVEAQEAQMEDLAAWRRSSKKSGLMVWLDSLRKPRSDQWNRRTFEGVRHGPRKRGIA